MSRAVVGSEHGRSTIVMLCVDAISDVPGGTQSCGAPDCSDSVDVGESIECYRVYENGPRPSNHRTRQATLL